jgi:ATP-dependent helicase/nuclease subunit A
MKPVTTLDPLKPEQASAAEPQAHAWVAASAGTGKTQVLSARVLRLLLQGTPPHAILCLTFTKLAAAEMQTRVFGRLAHWARCSDADLASDLQALRTDDGPEARAQARRLFAEVLDAPQGLAVQTIHAFAQGLIASFPVESGVTPGFATLDDRASALLRRRLLTAAIEQGDDDPGFMADLAAISIASGEGRLAQVITKLGSHAEALSGLRPDGIEPMLRRGFGLPTDSDAQTALAAALAHFDTAGLTRLVRAFVDSGGVTAMAAATEAEAWLLADDRAAAFDRLCRFFLTAKNKDIRKPSAVPAKADKADPTLKPLFTRLGEAVMAIVTEQNLHAAVAHAAAHLRVGVRLAAAWVDAKARLGVVDYDDMIAAAQRLLQAPGASDWVRYKLDQRIDHVLVDEAQDTNSRQWQIIEALTRPWFDGDGARDVQRTLFVVGDYKQAIFSFQGSDPDVYRDQHDNFAQWAADSGEIWRRIDLTSNFRSVPAVLTVVDAVADYVGHSTLDRTGEVRPHVAHRSDGAGAVTLWPPVQVGDDGEDGDDEAYAPKAEIKLAHQIAQTIAGWLNPAAPLLLPARGVPVRPQDILVLVRSRSGFSNALVAALHEWRVPVAGVDRMKLTDPLAVADLLAVARFALQPGDDLTLAALLVSPFADIGHDRLHALAAGRPGSLWQQVQASADPVVTGARDWLAQVLGFADFAAPYEFFERVLSDAGLDGRSRLLARLGEEARDAIDAVLDQALAFEAANAPSLQGFLAWVEADDIEIKRDPDGPLAAVRLMTVHGAKGLQAPVVIMADATRAPTPERDAPVLMSFDNGPELPVYLKSRSGLAGPLAERIDQLEAAAHREHCRLLYVALTRAEDLLFIGGTLRANASEVPPESWYATVTEAFETLDVESLETSDWTNGSLCFASGTPKPAVAAANALIPADSLLVPAWLDTLPPLEARPPRPLSPSAIAADDVSAPPQGPAAKAAARRGAALHALFERLPDLPEDRRRAVGEAWCRASVPELDAVELVSTVLDILADPAFAEIFAPGALVEAPIAAVVGTLVIAGKVDRLLVGDAGVTIVDFKTGRRVPASADAVEPYYLRQMAAYVAALEQVFPGRPVTAALLYTEAPRLITLPAALVRLHYPKDEV